ncbi:RHS repeat-associated core domain protein-containing protein [Pseudomonas sp. GM78]|uniref:RHS repeat-associated core domain-containing protein n=1 Tax=Pseudomonas sp. GM78 TaxID=1144337 RepID=UPI000270B284|nr:RHS repeat-associated core domain-containing protein [Pseudomonas sp. GM78]EJN18583.1 RHS repeat-associated core domain protein-containing protein [Pseudomonas sp. GM78]
MPSSHQSLICQYRYDALDRLINHAPTNEAQHQRFYCKSRLATEIQGALCHSFVQNGELLLAQQQRSGDALDTTLLATDQQRSVLRVVSKADQQPKSIDYSPYGHRGAENGLLSLLGFNGERPDPVTGHYLLGNGYRACNPVLIRFNSPDRLSPFEQGGLNSYAYCWGDPINLDDPTGRSPWGRLTTAISGTIEKATSVITSSVVHSRKYYVARARISRAQRKLSEQHRKLDNFIALRKETLDSLAQPHPRTKVEKLTTMTANLFDEDDLEKLHKHLDLPITLKRDTSAAPQITKLERKLSRLDAASIWSKKEKLIGFKSTPEIEHLIDELPKPKKLRNEIRRLDNKHPIEGNSGGEFWPLNFDQ